MKFNKLIPELMVTNFDKSLKFYLDIGFKVEYSRGEKEEEKKFALISFEGSQIMLDELKHDDEFVTGKLEYPLGRGINFQIEILDVEKIYKILKEMNYKIHKEIEENWYRKENKLIGNKEFMVMDPDGYLLRFAEDLGEK